MPNLLEMKDVGYTVPDSDVPVLQEINLEIGQGERIGITGPSGSGKSTLALVMTGLQSIEQQGALSGEIACPAGRPTVGLVMQNPENQLFAGTVAAEVSYGLTEAQKRNLTACLAATGVTELAQTPVEQLSLGQKQRVVLASFLAMQPDLLILDEPTNYLDPEGVRALFGLLYDIPRTVIVIEHDTRLLYEWADRVFEMEQGRIREAGMADRSVPINLRRPIVPIASSDGSNGTVRSASEYRKSREGGSNGGPVCRIERLECRFRGREEPVLTDISLELHRGERIALLGMNGSGKSTLLKHIAGLVKPARGRITFPGWSEASAGPGQPAAGLVFQNPDYQLFETTVLRECSFSLRLRKGTNGRADVESRQWLERTGIGRLAERLPFTLSTGEKRRLTLAGALTLQSRLLLLDEPTVALDDANLDNLRDLLFDLSEKEDMCVLFSTHDLEFALAAADRFLVLQDGRLEVDTAANGLQEEDIERFRVHTPRESPRTLVTSEGGRR
ncbi:ATP-binding cassette domain-containing protein [bacterium]|nr:ATP-binding cassette domain-containing protein [bacterium]